MLELFDYSFMQRAFIACLLSGGVASFFSVFVVQRKMSFLGSGLAHAAFGGVALGLLLEWNPILVAAPYVVITGLLVAWVQDKTELSIDTAIGVFFSVSMALGILLLSFKTQYSAEAVSFLFGSILSINQTDLIVSFLIFLMSLLSLKYWKAWAYISFDRELAIADGLKVRSLDYLLVFLISLSVVTSIKILGIILLSAFLVIPGATARLVSKSFFQMTIFSVAVGLLSSVAGLFSSYHFDLPSGPCIILIQAICFAIAMAARQR